MGVAPAGGQRVAVVIPCYRVRAHILAVLGAIGPEVERIYVVDDACPENTADLVAESCRDPRVRVLRHERNRGVGGATLTGYRQALEDDATVIVKLDGDGQMDPGQIERLVRPLLAGEADYAKGNRFFDLDAVHEMPLVRALGNAGLSFLTKLSTGYWDIFDPTNGFTAIVAKVARALPLDKLASRYFFESDILFRLSTIRAVVTDIPMRARYGSESSSLVVGQAFFEFAAKNGRNFLKRLFYNYFLRSFGIASVELLLGPPLLLAGLGFGVYHWTVSAAAEVFASAGVVMLAALPVIVGVQLTLAFLAYDTQSVPRSPIHTRL